MATNQFLQAVSGAIASSADYNTNFLKVQNTFTDIGPYVISGLVPSAGAGLAVSVSAGTAVIGARITASGSFSIAGLANTTTNHLYLLDTGVGTSNTSGTQPADSTKLGTATTAGGVVTSVSILRSSGRQSLIRPENQIPGAVGSMGSINLATWNATAGDTFQVYGSLPAGAMASLSLDGLSDVNLPTAAQGDVLIRNATEWVRLAAGTTGQVLTTGGAGANAAWTATTPASFGVAAKTSNYTIVDADTLILADATGGAFTVTLPTAVGRSGKYFLVKKVDSGANAVTFKGNGAELIDTANTQLLTAPESVIQAVSDGTQWWMI